MQGSVVPPRYVSRFQRRNGVLAAAGGRTTRRVGWPAGLTDREVTVLRLLAQGRSPAQIAAGLHISPKTVRNHVEHIYAKIGASNRTGAALFAVSHGLLGAPTEEPPTR